MLQTQNISIPFNRGVDTKSDSKLVSAPVLVDLQNGVFTKGGGIRKRQGYTRLNNSVMSGLNITNGVALANFEDELLAFDDSYCYSYSSRNETWLNRGVAVSLRASVSSVIRNSYGQSMPDSAICDDVTVYAWEDSRGGVRASVVDLSTGAFLLADVSLSNSGAKPKCFSTGAYLYVAYADGNNLCVRRINPSLPTAFDLEHVIKTNVNNSGLYDVVEYNSNAAVFAYVTTADEVTVGYITRSGLLGTALNGFTDPITVAETAENCIAIFFDSTNSLFWVAYQNASLGVRAFARNTDLSSNFTSVTLDSTTTDEVRNITGVMASGTTARFFWEYYASDAYNTRIRTTTVTNSGTAAASSDFLRSVGLASKAWVRNDIAQVLVAHDSTLQSTYFTVTDTGKIIGKHLSTIGGGLTSASGLPRVSAYGDGVFRTTVLECGKLRSESGYVFSLLGVSALQLDYTQDARFSSVVLGDNLHICGGLLQAYDGAQLVEHGFNLFPENLTATPSASGGNIATGIYLYRAVYEWTDAKGQLHRSAPSAPLTVSVTGPSGSVAFSIPTLRLTEKPDVLMAVYRTVANGDIYYKVTSIASPVQNDKTTDAVTSFTDTLIDADIEANEILYTQGGELDNDAPPGAAIIAAGKNRIFLVDERGNFWFSKERVVGDGVAFSLALQKVIPPDGGDITALAVLDDKVIVFKERRIYAFAGDGPTPTGDQDTFSFPDLVTTDVGCSNTNSIVACSEGLLFKSLKGIYLLNRSLSTSYVGADVEGYNGENVTSAVLIEDQNEIRFTTESGRALVYNYYYKDERGVGQWSTWTNYEANDAVNWNNIYVHIKSNGRVYLESSESSLDVSTSIPLQIETAWIKLAGLQGYQRIRWASLLGEFKSSHTLTAYIAYDYSDTDIDTLSFITDDALSTATYGDDETYGSGSVYGGDNDVIYQWRSRLPRQKCQSIRFKFVDLAATGESYLINGLDLEVGVKKGLFKTRQGKTI